MTTSPIIDLFAPRKDAPAYVVFGLGREVPSVVHATREDAVREAERLALDVGVHRLIVCEVTDTIRREVLADWRPLREPEGGAVSWMGDDDDSVCACAEPDDDGWIPHDGGPCPVGPNTKVLIRLRDKKFADAYPAKYYRWDWLNRYDDIIAYKVAEDTEPDDDGWIKHDGGPCPIDLASYKGKETPIVAYKTKVGCEGESPAHLINWENKDIIISGTGVVAYKVVSE